MFELLERSCGAPDEDGTRRLIARLNTRLELLTCYRRGVAKKVKER